MRSATRAKKYESLLRTRLVSCAAYLAENELMTRQERKELRHKFICGRIKVMIATDYNSGSNIGDNDDVDFPDSHFLINFDFPETLTAMQGRFCMSQLCFCCFIGF